MKLFVRKERNACCENVGKTSSVSVENVVELMNYSVILFAECVFVFFVVIGGVMMVMVGPIQ